MAGAKGAFIYPLSHVLKKSELHKNNYAQILAKSSRDKIFCGLVQILIYKLA